MGGGICGTRHNACTRGAVYSIAICRTKVIHSQKIAKIATAKVVKITTQSIANRVFLQYRLIEYYLQQAFLRKPQHLQMQ